ncbi:Helicase conserved C-terminal domain-containing protein [Raineyella antarctica]|uniref:Helicase conserved C-terminal domain-containing protein n=1 Tax=Raineyella antarctica TaxID=1577474 RepID=A0A1G6GEI7_9ACTN|nr:helicase-associated domain-containing protein [Raineyella antarctica]SDB80319.1 Helicase conserved C-terminal domain-containing protein [Raineyella antarctica]
MSPAAPRSLAETLRRWKAGDFAALLQARPDLCTPPPRTVADLVTRMSTGGSTLHALHRLNAWQHVVAEALAALPDGATRKDVATLLGATDELAVRRGIADLRARGLVWGAEGSLHLVAQARTAFGPWPGGLPEESAHPLTERQIGAALQAAGETVRPLLDQLVWGPPTGRVRNADRQVTPESANTPMEVALAYGLLRPLDPDTVVMPREVALHLRGHRLVRTLPAPTAPDLGTGHRRRADLIDRAGVGAAITVLRDIEQLVSSIDDLDVRLLRDGGLGAKDLNAVVTLLRLPGVHPERSQAYAALLVELAWAAGLVNQVNAETLLPTAAFDQWLERPAVERWSGLVRTWIATPRWFAWSVRPKAHALGPDADWRGAVDLRHGLLAVCAEVEPGTVVGAEALGRAYAWHRPALASQLDLAEMTAQWWEEAAALGLQALDAVTGLMVVAAADAEVPAVLAEEFPEPIDELILQSDLTAVAPGPLAHEVGRTIRLLAAQESRGAGGVFRFSAASLRRAFDAGWNADRVLAWLAEHSSTGVPQPLEYLVGDVARRHGRIRVGTVGSWIQTDDDAVVSQLLAHPEAGPLGLRRLAPSVIVADAEADEVVGLLHRLGLSPAAEDSAGRLVTAPTRPRARPRPVELPPGPPGPEAIAELAEELAGSLS